jgi:hypothetical protein
LPTSWCCPLIIPGVLGGGIPYKGALDENVPVGNADVFAVTRPLSILAMAATMLLFTGGIPADGFGGVERLAVFRSAAGWSS